MLGIILYIKSSKHRHLFGIAFLMAIFVFFVTGCRENEKAGITEKEKRTGIHEKFERGPAIVTLDLDHKEITIAERLRLKISVTVNEDYEFQLPGFGEKLEQFGIVDYHTTQPELLDNNTKKVTRSYVLEPFLSGDYTIPPMEIKFWKKSNEKAGEHKVETSEIKIKVKSLLPDELKDVKLNDIKPPVAFPRSYILWIWAGAAAVIICAGVIIAAFIIRKRRNAAEEAAALKIPAHELAYEELKKLIEEELPGKGEIKLFYQRISGILRHYVENRFGLHAPEQTTEEFLAGLEKNRDFPEQYKTLLKTFLNHCDLVKFAEHQPKTEDIQKTFDSCRAFIEGTEEKE